MASTQQNCTQLSIQRAWTAKHSCGKCPGLKQDVFYLATIRQTQKSIFLCSFLQGWVLGPEEAFRRRRDGLWTVSECDCRSSSSVQKAKTTSVTTRAATRSPHLGDHLPTWLNLPASYEKVINVAKETQGGVSCAEGLARVSQGLPQHQTRFIMKTLWYPKACLHTWIHPGWSKVGCKPKLLCLVNGTWDEIKLICNKSSKLLGNSSQRALHEDRSSVSYTTWDPSARQETTKTKMVSCFFCAFAITSGACAKQRECGKSLPDLGTTFLDRSFCSLQRESQAPGLHHPTSESPHHTGPLPFHCCSAWLTKSLLQSCNHPCAVGAELASAPTPTGEPHSPQIQHLNTKMRPQDKKGAGRAPLRLLKDSGRGCCLRYRMP